MDTFTITITVSPDKITHEITEKPIGITEAQYDALIIKALGTVGGEMARKMSPSPEFGQRVVEALFNVASEELKEEL